MAPYAANLIAGNLLLRAKQMSNNGERDHRLHLQQAILAGEAKEIVGGLSPAIFFETLSQQNIFEIRAESSFLGTLSQIDPAGRLRAFEKEVALGVFTDARESEKTRTGLNYIIQQITTFRRLYNEYEEVGAAESCLERVAKFQRIRLRHEGGWINQIKYLGMSYSDLVTRSGTSIARLLLCDVIIVIGFFVAFSSLIVLHPCNKAFHPTWLALGHSMLSFMELQPGLTDYEEMIKCGTRGGIAVWVFLHRSLLFAEIVLAWTNLGLLISILYRRVTRRVP